jgi:hypothetical protein
MRTSWGTHWEQTQKNPLPKEKISPLKPTHWLHEISIPKRFVTIFNLG